MKKEEILEKSRKENKYKNMPEIEEVNRASRIAAITGPLLCMVISFLEELQNKKYNGTKYNSITIIIRKST